MFYFSILHIIMKHKTGCRGGMLNLYSVYSASNVRRLCALLCPAISFLQLHVLQFHALHIGPSFSRLSFSRPAFSASPFLAAHWGSKVCSFGQWATANCAALPTANAGWYEL